MQTYKTSKFSLFMELLLDFFLLFLIYAYIKFHWVYAAIKEFDTYETDGVLSITFTSLLVFVVVSPFVWFMNAKALSQFKYVTWVLYALYVLLLFSLIYWYFPRRYI
jgi:hypothetical protein